MDLAGFSSFAIEGIPMAYRSHERIEVDKMSPLQAII